MVDCLKYRVVWPKKRRTGSRLRLLLYLLVLPLLHKGMVNITDAVALQNKGWSSYSSESEKIRRVWQNFVIQEEALPVQLRDPVLAMTQEKYRIRICCGCGFKLITKACVLAVVVLLLLLSGDVELNPGPPKLDVTKPQLKDLVNMYIEDWYGLGLLLGVSEHDLDIIRHDYRDKLQDCRREMFKLWLKADSDASYMKLVSTLHAVGDHWNADRLIRQHGLSFEIQELLPPSNIAQYAELLKSIYRDFDVFPLDGWPPIGGSEFIIPSLQHYVNRPSLVHYLDMPRPAACKITPENIFQSTSSLLSVKYVYGIRELFDGSPGSGKTVLGRHNCKRWAEGTLLEAYFLVVYIALRDIDVSSASRIEDLLSYGKDSLRKAVAEELQATSGEGALFILDGWDELQHELRHKHSLVCKILFRNLLPKCSVLITSRPQSSAWMEQSKIVKRHMVIIGFTEAQVKKCVASEFCENPSEGDKLVSLLESCPDLAKLCNIPLNLAILMYMYKANNHTLPNTLTKIYQKFIINALHHHMSRCSLSTDVVEFHTVNELPDCERELYKAMRKLSFDGFCNDELVFSQLCLKKYHSDLPENALGLMAATKTFTDTGIKSKYQFPHASIQEFLAAEELSIQAPHIQVDFLRKHLHEDRFRLMILFFCGQAHISSELESIFRYPVPILGSYFFYQHWYQERYHQIRTLLLLMEMILESQNKELCLTFSLTMCDMSLDLADCFLSKHDHFILANFLCFGGCKWRTLNLEECRAEIDALNQFSEILKKSIRTVQFENLYLCPSVYDSESIHQLLNQPIFQSLNALKLQVPYTDVQIGLVTSPGFKDFSSLNLHHLYSLSSLTIDAVLTREEFSKVIQLLQTLKSLTSLQLLPEGNICIQELDWSQDSVNTKAFGSWLPQCKTLQIKGTKHYSFKLGDSEFPYNINQSCFHNVQKLHLTCCCLNSEQAHRLFTYLHNSSITELDLSGNYSMFSSPKAAKRTAKSFFATEVRVQLNRAAEALCSFLKATKTLMVLNLSSCGVDGFTMNIIANGISLCRTLTQFDVGRLCKISGSGISALCDTLTSGHKPRTGLPHQSSMKLALFFKFCHLNDKDATKIAQVLQNSSQIVGLDLSYNDISASGASAIMSSVGNSFVKTINLSANDLGKGDKNLSQAFERALSTSSKLEELIIKYTHLRTSAMRSIALGLARNSSLKCLNMQSHSGTNAAVLEDILRVVTSNGTLKELHFDVKELEGAFMFDSICNILLRNNTLTTLTLGHWTYHHNQCQDLVNICQALRQNFTLTKLTLKFILNKVEWRSKEGTTDLEICAIKESDSVNLIRARERKPYVTIKIHLKYC